MDTTVINDAKRIISQMNTGNECDYMEAGYLYYGMGLYGFQRCDKIRVRIHKRQK